MKVAIERLSVTTPDGRTLLEVPRLDIKSGESCLLRGPSGLGKSTLLQMIGALTPVRDGRVTVGEMELSRFDASAAARFRRAHVSFVFQRLNLIDHLTTLENLTVAVPYAVDRARVDELLERFELTSRAGDLAATLSPGESQRVALIRTLTSPASLVLADEPTSSLDAANATLVAQTLKNRGARTLICVSHDERIADAFDHVHDLKEWAP